MAHYIIITVDRKEYKYLVEQLPSTQSFDFYKVSGNNGFVIFKNNKPVMNRYNLKHRKPQWKEVSSNHLLSSFKEAIIKALEAMLGY